MDMILTSNGHLTNWTEPRTEQLEKLFRDGLSFSLIAAEIGVSRNAVIGKVHRLKLAKRTRQPSVRKPMPINNKPRRRKEQAADRPPALKFNPIPEPVVIPGKDYTVSIDELTDSTCRYPLWRVTTPHKERFYCGAPGASLSAGLPYCRRHRALCWPH